MENPLLKEFNTPEHTAPFSQIKVEHYLPAIKALIERQKKEIEEITSQRETPTFQNTLEPLAYSGEGLDIASSLLFNLNSADTSAALQKVAQEASPLLSEFSSQLAQNRPLFERIQSVYDQKQTLNLKEEETTLLEDTYKGFVRGGALLEEEKKKHLEELNKKLSIKSLQFGENLLEATNSYFKHITDPHLLEGVPKSILETYREEAKERQLEGYVITLDYPSYLPALTYLKNRELRKELYLANGRKAYEGGKNDNQTLIKEITSLRHEKAQILGYKDYASYVLEERMAENPQEVSNFLNELLEKATPYAKAEISKLQSLAKDEGIEQMEAWDHAYFAEKLKEKELELKEEELRPYFELGACKAAVFSLAERLYGLSFEPANDIEGYHPDVKVYRVLENGTLKAVLYTDFHPRKSKRSGAWMTSYQSQLQKDGVNKRPHISVVCNFSKPTETTPSLLTFNELTTLFHEFGHALHGILANSTYPSLSGTSVKWDFVELPSQFMENYCYEKDFLSSFAKHYQTGEPLSEELIEKLSKSKSFLEGYQTLRQLGFGLLDLAYHTNSENIEDIKVFETTATESTNLYPLSSETAVSPSFAHIFQGGYAAGYYSYKWAEVLDADAFDYFKENGIFDPQIAEKFKQLLASGGSKNPMKLYKEFRGREPKVESLLKRAFR